jgi:hypothetical protein
VTAVTVAHKLALALASLALVAADAPIDSPMLRDPLPPKARPVYTHHPRLVPLLIEALDRPDADTRARAALALADVRGNGAPGTEKAVPALEREVARADRHPAVALACARALVALDSKASAPKLLEYARATGPDARAVVEPVLARWKFAPAADVWLARLTEAVPKGNPAVLAARGLAALGHAPAVPRVRELALSPRTDAPLRIESALALGTIRTTGGEADADALAARTDAVARVCAAHVLREHSGPDTVKRLQALARDAEPAVAAAALPRLLALDPANVEPVLPVVLASPDANVRGYGVECLRRRRSAAHIKLLGARLADEHPDVRAAARGALNEHAPAQRADVLDALDAALAGTDWRANEQAALLAGQLKYDRAAQRLVALLGAKRHEPGIAAAWALRQLALPDTLAPALAHFKAHLRPNEVNEGRDKQLAQLAQFFGERRYAEADPALRGIVPPKSPAGNTTRAAACWALGYIQEGKAATAGLTKAFLGRLNAVTPFDIEDPLVRRTCAIALARTGEKGALPDLRKYWSGQWSVDPVSNSCGWALEVLTGEKFPPPGTFEVARLPPFIVPVD